MRIAILLLALVVGTTACAAANADPWSKYESEVDQWGSPVVNAGSIPWELRPYRRSGDKTPCIAYRIPGWGGGRCFVAGWAVESVVIEGDSIRLLVIVSHPRVKKIRVPRVNGKAPVWLIPRADDALDHGLVVRVLGPNFPESFGNDIAGYSAEGVKLGNEHNNVGKGTKNDFGPCDGLLDHEHCPSTH